MSQSEKAALFNALKGAGMTFDKHYREYNSQQLREAYDALADADVVPPWVDESEDEPVSNEQTVPRPITQSLEEQVQARIPKKPADPNELPGQRLNSQSEDEPIRVDDKGLIWYQEEVQKSAFAKPRGRRVMKYNDPGVTTQEVKTGPRGEYVESFEVGGAREIPSEVKVTLPSYQVGIYKDPRLPFKIHVYAERRGFDFFEVQNYYGGPELVPAEIKRVYVENVLCFDIRTTVRAIETEYRQLQLAGKA